MTNPVIDGLFKVVNVVHPTILRLTGGRIGGRLVGMPVLVLTTKGRKTGKPHETPLTAVEHEGRTYVVASKGGDDRPPSWYLNLVADPDVTVRRDGRTQAMVARVVSPEERAQLWPVVTSTYKGYAGYQRRTDREIPVVELVAAG